MSFGGGCLDARILSFQRELAYSCSLGTPETGIICHPVSETKINCVAKSRRRIAETSPSGFLYLF
jgi:hypothetical protein